MNVLNRLNARPYAGPERPRLLALAVRGVRVLGVVVESVHHALADLLVELVQLRPHLRCLRINSL